ncbi:LLM class flavin-dependent oxidoreductase [Streptomyces spiralis]|uniref:LLM class flavin-dependent oxidoreductase n=1 Tax=Streptomyces spiralis TaxID=66376 RepID=UPI0036C8D8A4
MAGELGSDYAFAHFLVPGPARATLASYRAAYAEHTGRPAPGGVLAVRVITAESEDRAEALAQSILLWRSRKDLGEDLPLPAPKDALTHRWTALEAERAAIRRDSLVWGTPDQVRERLTVLATEHGVDEVMVNTLTCDPADRLASYRSPRSSPTSPGPGPQRGRKPREPADEAIPSAGFVRRLPLTDQRACLVEQGS